MKNRILRVVPLALSLALLSCAHSRVITGPIDPQRLFPFGTYRHSVVVHIPAQKKTLRLQGVLKLTSDHVQLYALSPFGTTVFRIRDDLRKHQTQIDIYLDEIKKHEASILDFYGVMRTMLSSLRSAGVDQPTFEVTQYDRNHLPERMILRQPTFTAEVRVTGYEL